jgi:fucose 4-O-acetylase-like acetyltransferase
LLRNSEYKLPGKSDFYTTSPLYLIIRLGCVLLICALLYVLETRGKYVPKPVQLAGQESLLVYGVHLWIIFALLRGTLLGPVLGLQAGYAGCFLMSLLIIIFMLYLARRWHDLKKKYPDRVRLGQAVIVMLMIIIFVLN